MNVKNGFIPALATPLNDDGSLNEVSYRKQIEAMLEAGAVGMLSMGSMGAEAALSSDTFKRTAEVAADTVKGKVPLFVGAMDNSVYRLKERFEMLEGLEFDGIVLTTPFYSTTSEANLIKFFSDAADIAPKPVYLYDLPGVTKQKITFSMVTALSKHPNIKGIKSGDIVLCRKIMRELPEFSAFFSNIDIFDVGCSYGLPVVLDGMFTVTPKNAKLFGDAYAKGDFKTAGKYLDNIVAFRDFLLPGGLWPSYTIAMNLIGFDGYYGHGYDTYTTDEKSVKEFMTKIGEL